ncbi:hypothetical protein EDD16DRAFT_1700654 [Pisolithus croceorrhizus]|nr:hypothetical protein EDD16DRAFT_1700654 [Pisolithus croceorrhizus]
MPSENAKKLDAAVARIWTIYKERIINLEEMNDMERFESWKSAVKGMADELIAVQPIIAKTDKVPATLIGVSKFVRWSEDIGSEDHLFPVWKTAMKPTDDDIADHPWQLTAARRFDAQQYGITLHAVPSETEPGTSTVQVAVNRLGKAPEIGRHQDVIVAQHTPAAVSDVWADIRAVKGEEMEQRESEDEVEEEPARGRSSKRRLVRSRSRPSSVRRDNAGEFDELADDAPGASKAAHTSKPKYGRAQLADRETPPPNPNACAMCVARKVVCQPNEQWAACVDRYEDAPVHGGRHRPPRPLLAIALHPSPFLLPPPHPAAIHLVRDQSYDGARDPNRRTTIPRLNHLAPEKSIVHQTRVPKLPQGSLAFPPWFQEIKDLAVVIPPSKYSRTPSTAAGPSTAAPVDINQGPYADEMHEGPSRATSTVRRSTPPSVPTPQRCSPTPGMVPGLEVISMQLATIVQQQDQMMRRLIALERQVEREQHQSRAATPGLVDDRVRMMEDDLRRHEGAMGSVIREVETLRLRIYDDDHSLGGHTADFLGAPATAAAAEEAADAEEAGGLDMEEVSAQVKATTGESLDGEDISVRPVVSQSPGEPSAVAAEKLWATNIGGEVQTGVDSPKQAMSPSSEQDSLRLLDPTTDRAPSCPTMGED